MPSQETKRYFSKEQRQEHDKLVGHQCEWEIRRGQRCPKTELLEADHILQWAWGGLTDLDNLMWLCHAHHDLKTMLDNEGRCERLIRILETDIERSPETR